MKNLDIDKKGHLFEDLGRKKLSWIQKNVESDENGDNPYMFGIPWAHSLPFLYQK